LEKHKDSKDYLGYSGFSSVLAHNGIICINTKKETNYLYSDDVHDFLYIGLCHDIFRPEMNIARDNIKSVSLDLLSEFNLALRKAIDDFVLNTKVSSEKFTCYYPKLEPIKDYYVKNLSVDQIYSLRNFDSWFEYFSRRGEMEEYLANKYDYFKDRNFINMIYTAVFQKYKFIDKYDPKTYNIVVGSGINEQNNVIDKYYPPFFFLPMDNNEILFFPDIKSYYIEKGFLNRNNDDVEWLITNIEILHDKYPALFTTLIDKVINGNKDEFDQLWSRIKALNL
jgi:hypothetical protein